MLIFICNLIINRSYYRLLYTVEVCKLICLSVAGVDMSESESAHFTRTRSRSRSLSAPATKRARTTSASRSVSRPARDTQGVKDVAVRTTMISLFSFISLSLFLSLPVPLTPSADWPETRGRSATHTTLLCSPFFSSLSPSL